MNEKKNMKILMAGMLVAFFSACSSDDTEPPPALDCNVTGPSVSLTASPTACGEDNGEIALTITGGTGALTITIEPQPIGVEFANNIFSSMESGTYTVTVTDTDNCITSAQATVVSSAANPSYMTDVDPIVLARCAITGCHVAGTGLPDYTIFSEFQSRAHNNPGGVRQRVKIDDMPRSGNPLTAEEKAAIFCWIDEGALDN